VTQELKKGVHELAIWRVAGNGSRAVLTSRLATLDDNVELRGSVPHRGSAANSVQKAAVTDYYEHVRRLVGKTGGRVNSVVKKATSRGFL
jgi:hypothetical protein